MMTPQQQTKIAMAKAVYKVPFEFQPRQHHCYPSDNNYEFERWFFDTTPATELIGKLRTYLPIFWTAYWCNNGYGKKTGATRRIQHLIDCLPRNQQYWTICQYDDGPMVDFKDLDIKVFGMSGGQIDYPIPLLCMPHKYIFPGIKKDIFCSFIGADTHPIRRELVKEFAGKSDCLVSFKKVDMKAYCEILARSVFALAPRGYGKSSFRIVEALQYGAIPVYISDEFIIPYNDVFPGDMSEPAYIQGLYEHLKTLNIEDDLHLPYAKNYTYQGCKKKIIENI